MELEGEWVPFPWCLGTDYVWAGPSSQRVATSPAPLILAPGPLGDATPSSRGGAPSGPWVAALFGVACFALGDRPCAGQLALAHGLSRVRLQHLNRLVLGSGSWVAALSGVARSPSVGRLRAGHLALHMASTVRGCGASAPLDSDSSPNRWGPFKLAPSSRGRSLTRPRMAAGPLQVARFGASVGRVCAGQLALHMASTVRGCGASAASILAQPSWRASSQG
jgi:hypothetical protein